MIESEKVLTVFFGGRKGGCISKFYFTPRKILTHLEVQCPKRKIFSFSAAQGKSRGDRVYVNEDSISAVNKIRYINTPFLNAHKIMTFAWQEDMPIGPSPWKMNSSVLNDSLYVTEIEEIFQELEALHISNPVEWWDLFIFFFFFFFVK